MKRFGVLICAPLLVALIGACQPIQPAGGAATPPAAPAATDAAALVLVGEVQPVLETRGIYDADEGPTDPFRSGDADDPAIWLHPTDAALSLVITALKDGGGDVYDLDGQLLQEIAPEGARYNNVDLIYGFVLGGAAADLAVFSDRYTDNLAIYRINPDERRLEEVSDPANPLLFTPAGQESDETTTAYGVATWLNSDGRAFALVSRRETGEVALLELADNGAGLVSYWVVRTFELLVDGVETADLQTEGMVVDAGTGTAYIGQENVGFWRIERVLDEDATPELVDQVGGRLQPDVEGLTIYYGPGDEGYLLVSSQGDNTFAVYSRVGNTYLGSFAVAASGEIDSVEESDGAHVLNVPLGDRFASGLLVVQDGGNDPEFLVEDEGEMENTNANFKYVPWESVAALFDPPLLVDVASWAPR